MNNQIDVDSIMKGLNTNNKIYNNVGGAYPIVSPSECSQELETQYSRHTHPSYNYRGLTTPDMRLSYPLHDPQCQIFEDFSINTRLQAKDNHKTIWQQPMDQSNSLPSSNKNNKHSQISNCNYALFN